ncbi:right-handed parallel beta-helix repeat-containing protein [Rhodobacter sp. Har01]|uniref:right-handed parallel beta-helix repeat-containing protein n=1 Tax=Rhodobacter sp. Har01 TaxID=2883999 RepID=UPI001D0624D6|nr:right-handed parallel beta-helix repeat-containing protein [Rhodobacter sp. Har01]MCB6179840.1 right-handed parallel beta-helix repeat-containing protein [Rhodobacter sp. Har01]
MIRPGIRLGLGLGLGLGLAILGRAAAALAGTLHAEDAQALGSALSEASAGDVILLAPGDYGAVELRGQRFDPPITIRSARPGGAVFDSLSVSGSDGLRFVAIHVSHPGNGAARSRVVEIEDSNRIEIVEAEVNGRVDDVFDGHFGIYIQGGEGLRLVGIRVHDVKHGIAVFGARDVTVAENRMEDIGEDSFKFAGVDGVLVENNTGPERMFPAEGAHEDFMQFQGGPSRRVTIRGNVFLPQNSPYAQGIFVAGDGGHADILIEENIIATAMLRGISVNEGSRITIRRNTVVGLPSKRGTIAGVVAPDGATVEENIWSGKRGQQIGSNIVVQGTDPAEAYHYDAIFRNALRQPAPRLADLAPVAGGPGATLGAVRRLRTLLGNP